MVSGGYGSTTGRPTGGTCMGYAENTGAFDEPNGFKIVRAGTDPLIVQWPNPEVVKVGNRYHSFADPPGYPGKRQSPSHWTSRQLCEAVSDDGLTGRSSASSRPTTMPRPATFPRRWSRPSTASTGSICSTPRSEAASRGTISVTTASGRCDERPIRDKGKCEEHDPTTPLPVGHTEQYIVYHDQEWGVPVHDDRTLFEFLILEGAQAGLSWQTILGKRENYREAFDHFDAAVIARYGKRKQQGLLSNPGIVRNRLKIAAVQNARPSWRFSRSSERSTSTSGDWSATERSRMPGSRWPRCPHTRPNRMP